MLLRSLPLLFALLWSTGFIGARYGLPYIGPFAFLAIRLVIALLVLLVIIKCCKLKFPRLHLGYLHVFGSGLLIHVAYLGGVFYAIKSGLPVGQTAMIVGMQPILTAILVHRTHFLKILMISLLGFVGLLCVLGGWHLLVDLSGKTLLPAGIALVGITLGTIYQKNKCTQFNVVVIAFLQYLPATLVFAILAVVFERGQTIMWNGELVFALLWLALVLSIGTIVLMGYLYRKHSAAKVANFFYLAPPLALLQGKLFFGEVISGVNMVGMALVVVSLYLTSKVMRK